MFSDTFLSQNMFFEHFYRIFHRKTCFGTKFCFFPRKFRIKKYSKFKIIIRAPLHTKFQKHILKACFQFSVLKFHKESEIKVSFSIEKSENHVPSSWDRPHRDSASANPFRLSQTTESGSRIHLSLIGHQRRLKRRAPTGKSLKK